MLILKHPSRVPSFDDLSNFVNAVTINGVTHLCGNNIDKYDFFFHMLEARRLKIAKKVA